MPADLAAALAFGAVLLGVVGLGEALRAGLRWPPEWTRRLVHALTGVAVALCPPYFSSPWPIAALAGAFVLVNAVAIGRRWLPSMHGVERRSWGTVTFPLALLFALVACWWAGEDRVYVLQIAFLVVGLADPLAAWAGSRWGGRSPKSAVGGGVVLVTGTVLTGAGLMFWGPPMAPMPMVCASLATGLAAAGAEWLGRGGWDNLFVVVAVVVALLLGHQGFVSPPLLLGWWAVGVGFAWFSWRSRFVDGDAAVAVAMLAVSVLALGPAWAAPGVTFFVLSSALSRLGRRRKAAAAVQAEKGSRRDTSQVYSNGGVSWAMLVGFVIWPDAAWYWGFAGGFAAAAADTWATEIGTWLGGRPRSVLTGQRVPRGASGGVTVAGTAGALAGAATVFVSLVPFAGDDAGVVGWGTAALLVVGGGFVAAFVDSVLGASVQAVYRLPGGALTERAGGPGGRLPLERGWAWVDNDRVNVACTLVGGLVPLLALALG